MKGDQTRKVLEAVVNGINLSVDLMAAFLESGYGASSGKIEYNMNKRTLARHQSNAERQVVQNYHNLLYKLTRDKLIVKNGEKVAITKQGHSWLEYFKEKQRRYIPKNKYEVAKSNSWTIIAFDIPEKERRKRTWLRAVLPGIGFAMLQKSVWLGKVKLPEQFLKDINEAKLVEYLEIFEITKAGSLRHIS